jgi:hypothetical protein
MNFETWMQDVDATLVRESGVTSDTIPDMPWHDWWDAGYTVDEACDLAIRITDEGLWV